MANPLGKFFFWTMGVLLTLGIILWALGVKAEEPAPRAVDIDCGEGRPGIIVKTSSPHYETVRELAGGDGPQALPPPTCDLIMNLDPVPRRPASTCSRPKSRPCVRTRSGFATNNPTEMRSPPREGP